MLEQKNKEDENSGQLDDSQNIQNNGLDPKNIKVLVSTSFCRPSGDHGTPMFSRIGKQTAVEILEFHGEPMVQCDSHFTQEKKLQALAKMDQNGELLDEKTLNDFKTIKEVKDFERKKNQLHKIEEENYPGRTVPKKNKKQQINFTGNFENQNQMQEFIEQEEKERKQMLLQEKERQKRVRNNQLNTKDPFDLQEKKNQYNNLSIPFKNTLDRAEEPVYKIIQGVPKNLNDGFHNPQYTHVYKNERSCDFTYRQPQDVNQKFFKVPPCVLAARECSYESRQKAKIQNKIVYNSILQMAEPYFQTRNLTDNFKDNTKNQNHDCNRINVESIRKSHNKDSFSKEQKKQIQNLIQDQKQMKLKSILEKKNQMMGQKINFQNQISQMKYSLEKGMGAPYIGFYSSSFNPSSQDGNYRGKSLIAVQDFHHIVREENNMAGRDANFNQVIPNIPSPVPLDKQKERDAFSKYGCFGPVYGAQYLNEQRFIRNENDLTTVNSKYKSYNSPHFGNWADHSIDEFIKNYSSCAKENSNNQSYYPNFELVERNEFRGVPDFKRYTKRQDSINTRNLFPNSVDADNLKIGFEKTHKSLSIAVPFQSLKGRDKLYEKMHGLPLQTKEEIIQSGKKYLDFVNSNEFLPNSILRSPKRSYFSNSSKTKAIGLFNLDDHSNLKESLNSKFNLTILNTASSALASTDGSTRRQNNSTLLKVVSGRNTDLGFFDSLYKYQASDFDKSQLQPNSPTSPFKATLKNTFKFNDSAMKIKNSMMSTTMGETKFGELTSRKRESDFQISQQEED